MVLVGQVQRGVEMIRDKGIEKAAIRREGPAYRHGWEDGRFGTAVSFAANPSLASWTEHFDRLAYYQGHRDGRRVREMLGATGQTA
jgi:hypothetical protein